MIVCVGTPSRPDGSVDLFQINEALGWVIGYAQRQSEKLKPVIVMKSTVAPRTGEGIRTVLQASGLNYISNPEFLKQGQALQNWFKPDRIVIGVNPRDSKLVDDFENLYRTIKTVYLRTDITTSEMIKYTSNAFLATRISFINEIASLCTSLGVDTQTVQYGLNLDTRTGAYLSAGVGYGGSCLPKDLAALNHLGQSLKIPTKLLKAVQAVNDNQNLKPVIELRRHLGDRLLYKTIGILGLSFKQETSDVRNSPALTVIQELERRGADIKAHDPEATWSVATHLSPNAKFCLDPVKVAVNSHAIVLMTDWRQYHKLDWELYGV